MLSGDLRKRIIIQSQATSQDSFGQQVITWSDVLAGETVGSAKSVTAISAGALTTLTSAAHGFTDGQLVRLAGIVGAANLNASFEVTGATVNTFQVRYNSTGLTLTLSTATAQQVSGVPASIRPLYAFEKTGGGQASEVHKITVRYNAALANPVAVAAMRVCYLSRILEVTGSINVEERNRELDLMCTEGLTQG